MEPTISPAYTAYMVIACDRVGRFFKTYGQKSVQNRAAARRAPLFSPEKEPSAAGVGLFVLALFSTMFLVIALWIIEGFEPQTRVFELAIKLGDKTQDLRPKIEEVLRRYKVRYELRTTAEDSVVYMVTTPRSLRTDRVSNVIMELVPEGKGAVEWNEKPKDKIPK